MHHLSRRSMVAGGFGLAAGLAANVARAQQSPFPLSLPIGLPGNALGDGFIIRHGYACENTWYNPGWWHTGEDWYRLEGNTAGAGVYAVGDGEIVFAGSDYPGKVVIVQHADDLYSMYGHLDFTLSVSSGSVRRGQLLGTVLDRTDGVAPSHLHFEMRTFLTTTEVNGESPRYGVSCGVNCAPGPGYWPIDAPEHPSAMGWRNPLHTLAQGFTIAEQGGFGLVVAEGAPERMPVWSLPADRAKAEQVGEVDLVAGQDLPYVDIAIGPADSVGSSAEAYRLWFRTRIEPYGLVWMQAAVADDGDTGSDGRPSSVRLVLLQRISAA